MEPARAAHDLKNDATWDDGPPRTMTSPCLVHLQGTVGVHRQAQVATKAVQPVDDHGAESAGVAILQQPGSFQAAIERDGAAHTIYRSIHLRR